MVKVETPTDLGGSCRRSKTVATGDRVKETDKIKTLSSVVNIFYPLDENSAHVTYRDYCLLRDFLDDKNKTITISNVGPANVNDEEDAMSFDHDFVYFIFILLLKIVMCTQTLYRWKTFAFLLYLSCRNILCVVISNFEYLF